MIGVGFNSKTGQNYYTASHDGADYVASSNSDGSTWHVYAHSKKIHGNGVGVTKTFKSVEAVAQSVKAFKCLPGLVNT